MHVDFCWSVVMYTPHIAWLWDINVCHIFYNIFSIIFVKCAMLHPLKNLPNFVTSSVNHQSASVFGTKDYGMSLPINWQPVHNSIAFSFNGSSQTCIHNISTCYVRNAKTTSGKERPWWAFVGKHAMLLWSSSQLVGKRIPMSFVPNTLADWWLTDDVTKFGRFFRGWSIAHFTKMIEKIL